MCPVCLTTTMIMAGGIAPAGGLAAKVLKKAAVRKEAADPPSRPAPSTDNLRGRKNG